MEWRSPTWQVRRINRPRKMHCLNWLGLRHDRWRKQNSFNHRIFKIISQKIQTIIYTTISWAKEVTPNSWRRSCSPFCKASRLQINWSSSDRPCRQRVKPSLSQKMPLWATRSHLFLPGIRLCIPDHYSRCSRRKLLLPISTSRASSWSLQWAIMVALEWRLPTCQPEKAIDCRSFLLRWLPINSLLSKVVEVAVTWPSQSPLRTSAMCWTQPTDQVWICLALPLQSLQPRFRPQCFIKCAGQMASRFNTTIQTRLSLTWNSSLFNWPIKQACLFPKTILRVSIKTKLTISGLFRLTKQPAGPTSVMAAQPWRWALD